MTAPTLNFPASLDTAGSTLTGASLETDHAERHVYAEAAIAAIESSIINGGVWYAQSHGVVANGVTDCSSALNTLSAAVSAAGGGVVFLPPGYIAVHSAPVQVYPGVHFYGQGIGKTVLQGPTSGTPLAAVVQFHQSTNGTTDPNCFYGGLWNMTVDGAAYSYGPAANWGYGVSAITNPLLTTATADPDFDPYNIMVNVEIRFAPGHGFYANGRSGLRGFGCLFRYNYGTGAATSFDTQMIGCIWSQNGTSGLTHTSNASTYFTGKCYNNGFATQWTPGQNWNLTGFTNTMCMYGGTLYFPKNNLTSDTVAPPSDPTNWASQGAQPDWGYGLYASSSSADETMYELDCQQNAAGGMYFTGITGAVVVRGVARNINCNPHTGVANGSNPNNYAAIQLNNCSGMIVDVGAGLMGTYGYVLNLTGGSTGNEIRIGSDGSGTPFPSGTAMVGNRVQINGVTYTPVGIGNGAVQGAKLWSGSGVPSGTTIVGTASTGDGYFRIDTPTTANQRFYICTAGGSPGTWSGIL